jgi:hypothetical protein
MRNDYMNINGLATGVRGALKRQGVTVGKWGNGRIRGISHFTGGAEVTTSWDTVDIKMYNRSKHFIEVTEEEIENALVNEGIVFEKRERPWGEIIFEIQAEKYCLKVRP